jgi:uncharacterized Zn finger protein
MSTRQRSACPVCKRTATRFLPALSEHADENYYRCDPCGHVWTVPKNKPDAPPRHVSVPSKPKLG